MTTMYGVGTRCATHSVLCLSLFLSAALAMFLNRDSLARRTRILSSRGLCLILFHVPCETSDGEATEATRKKNHAEVFFKMIFNENCRIHSPVFRWCAPRCTVWAVACERCIGVGFNWRRFSLHLPSCQSLSMWCSYERQLPGNCMCGEGWIWAGCVCVCCMHQGKKHRDDVPGIY